MYRALLAVGIAVTIVVGAILVTPRSASAQFVQPSLNGSQVINIITDAGFAPAPPITNDVYGNSFIALNQAPDGGPGKYSFISNTDSCIKIGSGTNAEICAVGNTTTVVAGALNLATTFIQQPACPQNVTCRWFADVGSWFGVLPSSNVTGCASGTEGGLKANSTDHHPYYCDGTTAQPLPFTSSWSSTLTFSAFPSSGCQSMTFAATGAIADEPVILGGCGTVQSADPDLTCEAAITATDTASIRLCCIDIAGCSAPGATKFVAKAVR